MPDEPVLWARLYPAKFAVEAFQMDDAAFGARMKKILKALSAGRRGVDPLVDEMLEDVRKMPEAVRMPVDMPYRRPGGPHRFGEVGNSTWDRLPGKGYYFGMSRPSVCRLMRTACCYQQEAAPKSGKSMPPPRGVFCCIPWGGGYNDP